MRVTVDHYNDIKVTIVEPVCACYQLVDTVQDESRMTHVNFCLFAGILRQ